MLLFDDFEVIYCPVFEVVNLAVGDVFTVGDFLKDVSCLLREVVVVFYLSSEVGVVLPVVGVFNFYLEGLAECYM